MGIGGVTEWIRDLKQRLGPRAKSHEPLAQHTTFAIGGPAELFVTVETIRELLMIKAICQEHNITLRVLGRGSNVLIPDEGLPGVTAHLAGEFTEIKLDPATGKAKVGAAVLINDLSRRCADAGLSGFEWASGLPGTVGGAIVGNAGAWGGCIADVLSSVRLLEPSGHVAETPVEQLSLDYRTSALTGTDAVVLAAVFTLEACKPAAARSVAEGFRRRRRQTQPIGERSAGSVFRNPPDDAAGRLLEEAGCKGLRIGDAQVSTVHANFIINTGSATAEDVKALIHEMRKRVHDHAGIHLDLELKLL